MDNELNFKEISNYTRKQFKYDKPYWNAEIGKLWKNMCIKEKDFLKCKGPYKAKTELRQEFIKARKIFDKKLKSSKTIAKKD